MLSVLIGQVSYNNTERVQIIYSEVSYKSTECMQIIHSDDDQTDQKRLLP